jgi:FAD/FMN-containing dehydrogenase
VTRWPGLGRLILAQVQLTEAAIERLGEGFEGALITPADAGYDDHRRVWNGTIDRRPALVARCAGPPDVVAALKFAREHSLTIAVRGGGHSFAGYGTCDGGVVVDLSLMRHIEVDVRARTAIAQAGVLWGELNEATQAHGLAVTGGLISHTGIAGLTLGGGIGWLMRKHGLSCDNLLDAEVVTAGGEVLRANDEKNRDLFWALRGGGGNFGVVTRFTYRLHEVGPEVLFSFCFYASERGREILQAFRAFSAQAADDLCPFLAYINLPPAPFVPPERVGEPGWAVIVVAVGDLAAAGAALEPLLKLGPQVKFAAPMPYSVVNTLSDPGVPHGSLVYLKGHYAADLSDELIDVIVERAQRKSSPTTEIHVHALLGAIATVGEDDTAYSHRSSAYAINLISQWEHPDHGPGEIAWAREGWEAMKPFCAGGYVNFMDAGDSVRGAYGAAKFQRLVEIKGRYDPNNIFRLNQNIPAPLAG